MLKQLAVNQFTDSDGDAYSDAAEIKGQSDPNNVNSPSPKLSEILMISLSKI